MLSLQITHLGCSDNDVFLEIEPIAPEASALTTELPLLVSLFVIMLLCNIFVGESYMP